MGKKCKEAFNNKQEQRKVNEGHLVESLVNGVKYPFRSLFITNEIEVDSVAFIIMSTHYGQKPKQTVTHFTKNPFNPIKGSLHIEFDSHLPVIT